MLKSNSSQKLLRYLPCFRFALLLYRDQAFHYILQSSHMREQMICLKHHSALLAELKDLFLLRCEPLFEFQHHVAHLQNSPIRLFEQIETAQQRCLS
ncbi:hypothetical protein D3C86_1968850 [compost metagenome]